MQDSDPTKANYFNNRRALVGPACMVNSIFDGVKVLEGVKDLQNICNENMDDYAVMPSAVTAGVAASPIISIKDTHCYYAGNTQAGFTICANSDAGVLKLDLATFYKIQFYKDGEAVGEMKSVETEKGITGLGLSLLTIPGTSMVNKTFVATAPGDFDEIKLFYCGVDVNAISSINIKYAFVGKAREYTITKNKENGIGKYAQEQGRKPFNLEAHGKKPTYTASEVSRDKLIDEDLTNSFIVSAVLKIGTSLPVTVVARPTDEKEAFPAGTEVGFRFNSESALKLGVGDGATITLYNKDNTEIKTYSISGTVLGLGVLKKEKDGELSLRAPEAFSAVKLVFPGVVDLTLGDDKVNYAFVRMAPDKASHHCPIEATAGREVCGCENEFMLQHNPKVKVDWTITKQPNASDVKIVNVNDSIDKVTNLVEPGEYTFKATAADGCFETTTINFAPHITPADQGVTLLVNNDGEARSPKYELSDGEGFTLVNIFGGTNSARNILNPDLNVFAKTLPGIKLVTGQAIIGVKTTDKSHLAGNIDWRNHKLKAGFVVSLKATGLDLDILKFFTVELRKEGKKVDSYVTSHWGAISAGLIGSEKTHKMRLTVDVPEGCDFDEIVLYSKGIAGVDLSELSIYYAYISNADHENSIDNILYGGVPLSVEKTNASIDFANSKLFSVANIGNGYNQWSNLIDNSFDTPMSFPLGVSLGGATIALNIGKTVNPGQPLVMVTNKLSLGLGVELGKGLKLTTYYNGNLQEELTNWNVLGADVIGEGGNSYAMLKAKKKFNQVRITQVGVVKALSNLQIQGFAICSEIQEDGTLADCNILVLDENYTLDENRKYENAKMVFHRTFNKDKWNSLILPVDMTSSQIAEAFGEGTLISKYDRVKGTYILFEPVTTETEGYLLHANTPYIIRPTKEPENFDKWDYKAYDQSYRTITGPVYMVNTGIKYSGLPSSLVYEDHANCTLLTHYGSYERHTKVPEGSYMLNRGDLYHTAREHNVKAYRCWLEENNPSAESKPAGFSLQLAFTKPFDDTSTGIHVIEENAQNGAKGIYSLSGMRMDQRNGGKLPKSIYIINNKKVIVK